MRSSTPGRSTTPTPWPSSSNATGRTSGPRTKSTRSWTAWPSPDRPSKLEGGPVVEWLKIIGLGVVGAIAYGIAHDNVTARVCVEYFTIGHVPIFGTENPTLLALGWGVLATWWVGLGLGLLLALACRRGRRPK